MAGQAAQDDAIDGIGLLLAGPLNGTRATLPLRLRALPLDGAPFSVTATAQRDDAGRLLVDPDRLRPEDAARLLRTQLRRLVAEVPGETDTPGTVIDAIRCFAAGTRIATPRGAVPVEALLPGDRVLTRDTGFQPLRWVGRSRQRVGPQTQPVAIAPGALGPGQPAQVLVVSARHRVLLREVGPDGAARERLVPAGHLLGRPGIVPAPGLRAGDGIDYVHLQCARHEVIYAEAAPVETLLPGDQTLAALLPALGAWLAGAEVPPPPVLPAPARPLTA